MLVPKDKCPEGQPPADQGAACCGSFKQPAEDAADQQAVMDSTAAAVGAPASQQAQIAALCAQVEASEARHKADMQQIQAQLADLAALLQCTLPTSAQAKASAPEHAVGYPATASPAPGPAQAAASSAAAAEAAALLTGYRMQFRDEATYVHNAQVIEVGSMVGRLIKKLEEHTRSKRAWWPWGKVLPYSGDVQELQALIRDAETASVQQQVLVGSRDWTLDQLKAKAERIVKSI